MVLGYAAATFAVSCIPGTALEISAPIRIDLILHVVEYGVLAGLAMHALNLSGRLNTGRKIDFGVLVFSGSIGAANEFLQLIVPGRFASWSDGVANLTGAAIAVLMYRRLKSLLPSGRRT